MLVLNSWNPEHAEEPSILLGFPKYLNILAHVDERIYIESNVIIKNNLFHREGHSCLQCMWSSGNLRWKKKQQKRKWHQLSAILCCAKNLSSIILTAILHSIPLSILFTLILYFCPVERKERHCILCQWTTHTLYVKQYCNRYR